MRRVTIGILTAIVVLVLFVVLCTFRVRPYERVVLDRFGQVVKDPVRIMYGWYLCLPTDKVIRLDNRLHLHESPLQQLATSGGDTISAQAFAAWRIVDPEQFYRSFKGSDEDAQFRIGTEISGKLGDVMGRHRLEELFNVDNDKRATDKMEAEVTAAVNAAMKEQGVEVAQVGFSRMAFPPDVGAAVYERMSAERARKAVEYREKGKAMAEKIKSEAEADAKKIRATAARAADEIKAAGDKEALDIIARVASHDYGFYSFWRELDMLKNSFGPGTYVILQSGKPLGEQFFRTGIGPTPALDTRTRAQILEPTTQPATQPATESPSPASQIIPKW